MLFDHGVDSIVIGISTLIMAKCIDTGDNLWGLLPCVAVMSCFFFAMLEEYHKGIMHLPIGNGISDGSAVVIIGYFIVGITGTEWVNQPITQVMGIELNISKLISINLVLFQILTIKRNISNVLEARSSEPPEGLYAEPFAWSHFLSLIFSYVIMMAAIIGLTLIGKSPIHSNERPEGYLSYLLPITLLALSVQSYFSISMQVKHVTRQKFSPFRNGLLRFVYAGIFLIYVIVAMDDRIGGR